MVGYSRIGLSTWCGAPAYEAHFGLIPGFVTPDGALDHMNQVSVQLETLQQDVDRAKAGGAQLTFLAALASFAKEWQRFFNENKAWLPRFMQPGEIDNQTTVYEKQLAHLYELFKSESGQGTSLPTPAGKQQGDVNMPGGGAGGGAGGGGTADALRFAMYAGTAILGVGALGYIINAIRPR